MRLCAVRSGDHAGEHERRSSRASTDARDLVGAFGDCGGARVTHSDQCTCEECEDERDTQAVLWTLIVAAAIVALLRFMNG